MPSLAGFYATREDCLAWIRKHDPATLERNPRAGTGAVMIKAKAFLQEKGVRDKFDFRRVYPGPRTGADRVDPKFGLMLVRRYSWQKEYLDSDPVFDAHCKRVVEEEFDLPVSEWLVVWYDDEDPDMIMELLPPGYGPKP